LYKDVFNPFHIEIFQLIIGVLDCFSSKSSIYFFLPKNFLLVRILQASMARESPSNLRKFIYLLIAVIIPIIGILVNHLYRPDHILISIILIVWIGFFVLALEPFDTEDSETVEP